MLELFDLKSDLRYRKNKDCLFTTIDNIGIICFNNSFFLNQVVKDPNFLESIVSLYTKYGSSCFDKICNNLSVIICDYSNNHLFVATDKVGQKTFFYAVCKGILILSTEIKKVTTQIPEQISRESFFTYLSLGFIHGRSSIYQHINKIPPSHYLFVKNGKLTLCRYHNFCLKISRNKHQILKQNIKEKLLDYVKRYSKYETGVMLSGGFDSSLLCKFATQVYGKIKTFTLRIESYNMDTLKQSRKVSQIYGTQHKEIFLTAKDYVKNFSLVPGYLDEPIFDMDMAAIYLMLKYIPRNIQFLLHGFGSDEIFGDRLRSKGFSSNSKKEYLFVKREMPQQLLLHNKICSLYHCRLIFPFIDFELVKLGLGLSKNLKSNKYLLRSIDSETNRLTSFANRRVFRIPDFVKKALENYYLKDIEKSVLLKQLMGAKNLQVLLQHKRKEDRLLKLIIFHLWFNKKNTLD